MLAAKGMAHAQFGIGESSAVRRETAEHLIIFSGGEVLAESADFFEDVGAHHLKLAGRIAGMEYVV